MIGPIEADKIAEWSYIFTHEDMRIRINAKTKKAQERRMKKRRKEV